MWFIPLFFIANISILKPFAIETPPTGSVPIVVVLDESASVPPKLYEKFRTITLRIAGEEPSAVMLLGEKTEWVKPLGKPLDISRIPATPRARKTLLYDALLDAERVLSESGSNHGLVVLLSDGLDDGSTLIFDDVRDAYLKSRTRIISGGISAKPIGFRTLRRLALITQGKSIDLTSVSEADFVEEIQSTVHSLVTVKESPKTVATPAPGEQLVPPSPTSTTQKPTPPLPQPKKPSHPPAAVSHRPAWLFPLLAVAGLILVIGSVTLIAITRRKTTKRRCERCGRVLAPYEMECYSCSQQAEPETLPPSPEPAIESQWLEKEPIEDFLPRTVVIHQKPTLIIRRGKQAGAVYPVPLDRPIVIGRSSRCDITLEDPAVSGQHCRLVPKEGQWYLVDLKSTNGTFVNDHKIQVHSLVPGDVVTIGNHELMFRLEPVSTALTGESSRAKSS